MPKRSSSLKAISVGVTALLAAAGLAACGSGASGSSGDEILIGFPAALTGPTAAFGKPQAIAAQMAVDRINKAGGIKELGGKKLKLIVEDTKSNPATATQVVREMSKKGVTALVGPNPSPEVIASKPLIESLKIPTFFSAVDPNATAGSKYMFRSLPEITKVTENGLAYLKEQMGNGTFPDLKKVGILELNQPPGPAQLPLLKKGLEDLGLQTTVVEYDPTQVKDFAPLVAKFKAANVDMITGDQYPNDSILFAQAMGAQSWRPKDGVFFMGAPIYQDAFRQAVGDAALGWTALGYYTDINTDYFTPEGRELAKAFQAKTGQSLDQSSGASGASGVTLAADAIALAKSTDPKKVAAAAHRLDFADPKSSTYPYYTTPGGAKFDEHGNNTAVLSPVVQLVKNGGIVTISPTEIAGAKYVPYAEFN